MGKFKAKRTHLRQKLVQFSSLNENAYLFKIQLNLLLIIYNTSHFVPLDLSLRASSLLGQPQKDSASGERIGSGAC